MSIKTQNYINGRLSLRAPQAESLAKLKQALDAAPEMAQKDRDVTAVLNTLKPNSQPCRILSVNFRHCALLWQRGWGKPA